MKKSSIGNLILAVSLSDPLKLQWDIWYPFKWLTLEFIYFNAKLVNDRWTARCVDLSFKSLYFLPLHIPLQVSRTSGCVLNRH